MRSRYLIVSLGLVAAVPLGSLMPSAAAQQPAAAATAASAPVFDEAFMNSPENNKGGKAVWAGQCRHCHGNAAYPGKAPKLNPALLEPDFIFDRASNGFQKMPA